MSSNSTRSMRRSLSFQKEFLFTSAWSGQRFSGVDQPKAKSVTESQLTILSWHGVPTRYACTSSYPNTRSGSTWKLSSSLPRRRAFGGQLGRPSGARFRTYERSSSMPISSKGTIFLSPDLLAAIDDIYRYPLSIAIDTANRQLRTEISNEHLLSWWLSLEKTVRLCIIHE